MNGPILDETSGEVLAGPGPECPRCSAYRAQSQAMKEDMTNMERDLRALRRRASKAENELKQQREQSPEMVQVKTIFRHWVRVTGRDPKRVKLDTKRQKAVLERLHEGRDQEEILRAIDGVMLSDWNRENGVTDLEFVCRDAKNFERFRDLAERVQRSSTEDAGLEPLSSEQAIGGPDV